MEFYVNYRVCLNQTDEEEFSPDRAACFKHAVQHATLGGFGVTTSVDMHEDPCFYCHQEYDNKNEEQPKKKTKHQKNKEKLSKLEGDSQTKGYMDLIRRDMKDGR